MWCEEPFHPPSLIFVGNCKSTTPHRWTFYPTLEKEIFNIPGILLHHYLLSIRIVIHEAGRKNVHSGPENEGPWCWKWDVDPRPLVGRIRT